jgi:hypothetical protein
LWNIFVLFMRVEGSSQYLLNISKIASLLFCHIDMDQ